MVKVFGVIDCLLYRNPFSKNIVLNDVYLQVYCGGNDFFCDFGYVYICLDV